MTGGRLLGGRAAGARSWRTVLRALVLLVAAATAVFHSESLQAQSGGVSRAAGGGLRLVVDTQWPDGSGYRPVRVTFTPTAPPIADRTLVFELITVDRTGGREDEISVVQEIEIPAGSGPVTATLAVPHLIGHTSYQFRVGEGGREIRGLVGGGNFQNNSHFETAPRVLFVSDKNVSSSNLGRLFINLNLNPPQGNGQYPLPTLHTLAAKDLPSRWIDYSALDMICVSIGDLQAVERSDPASFEAIMNWAAAGGNLLVFDVGAEWQRLESLEKLVDLPSGNLSNQNSRDVWHSPRAGQFGKRVGGIGAESLGPYDDIDEQYRRQYQGYNPYGVTVNPPAEPKKPAEKQNRPKSSEVSEFATRPYEMGMIVAIATDKPFDEDPGFWAWVCNELTSRRIIWYQRHGISMHQDNPDFFKFLIEGVGKAPLNAFRILITLFVLAIGPFNYYLLRRFRRLHLLIVTVPVSAAAVTLALFAYAVFSDGLGTRVRVRSVTQINQATGQTECWARLSYYSGLAPAGGLTFSQDVAVYPFHAYAGDLSSGDRKLNWYDRQELITGWLRSRTPTQFLTVRSRKTQLGVDVGRADEVGLPITNRLATDMKMVVLRDKQGKLYMARDVHDDQTATAVPVEAADALADLSEEVQACRMANPPGFNPSNYSYSYRRRYYYYYNSSGTGPNPALDNSLMEGAIQEMTGRSGLPLSGLEPGTYVALVPMSPEVELGTSVARPEASLHLVIGAW